MFSAAVIIFLDFFCLFIRKDNTGKARLICDTDSNTVIQGMQDLEDYVNASLTEYIKRATEQLRLNFNAIYEENPPVGAGW